jgi:hypothetical protein
VHILGPSAVPKTLAEIAIEAGLVTRAEATRAGRAAEKSGVPLVVAFIRDLEVDELGLVAAIRKQTRVAGMDPGTVRPEADALRTVSREVCRRHRVLPVQLITDRNGTRLLRVAMADPTDATALAEVELVAGCELEVSVLPLSAIDELTEQGYRAAVALGVVARRPFGAGLHVATQPHLRRDPGEDTALTPSTVPFHTVADEADAGLRVRALVRVLAAKGLVTEAEVEEAVIDLMRAGNLVDPGRTDEE